MQGSQHSGKTWKIMEKEEKLKNQGKPGKLGELYLKIRGTRENSEFYFEIRFIFMLYIFSACPYVIIDLLLFSYLKI